MLIVLSTNYVQRWELLEKDVNRDDVSKSARLPYDRQQALHGCVAFAYVNVYRRSARLYEEIVLWSVAHVSKSRICTLTGRGSTSRSFLFLPW